MIRRRKNIRLKNFDYRSNYRHFITICTKGRINYLGMAAADKTILSETGEMALKFWMEIPDHFPHVRLDEFMIMPNHIHGIIKLDYPSGNSKGSCQGMNLLKPENRVYNKFSRPLSGSVSMIINHFKSAVKRWCNKNDYESFAWQPRFHDIIINNRQQLMNIRHYIKSDPVRSWRKNHPGHTMA